MAIPASFCSSRFREMSPPWIQRSAAWDQLLTALGFNGCSQHGALGRVSHLRLVAGCWAAFADIVHGGVVFY